MTRFDYSPHWLAAHDALEKVHELVAQHDYAGARAQCSEVLTQVQLVHLWAALNSLEATRERQNVTQAPPTWSRLAANVSRLAA
jgi:hypothetical protein